MTFSDSKVRRLLRTRFRCAWKNTEGDPSAGASFAHAPGTPAGTCIRGNGRQNVQLYVLTPQGELLNAVSGYVGSKDLVEELEFSLNAFASLRDRGRMPAAKRVAAAHRDYAQVLKKRAWPGPLGDWERRRALADHAFVEKHPLLDVREFRPETLVGNGRSFFGSSAGGRPADTIGDEEALRLVRRARKEHQETGKSD